MAAASLVANSTGGRVSWDFAEVGGEGGEEQRWGRGRL